MLNEYSIPIKNLEKGPSAFSQAMFCPGNGPGRMGMGTWVLPGHLDVGCLFGYCATYHNPFAQAEPSSAGTQEAGTQEELQLRMARQNTVKIKCPGKTSSTCLGVIPCQMNTQNTVKINCPGKTSSTCLGVIPCQMNTQK